MSVRRPAPRAALPLREEAVGAVEVLTDRLPGATRLSQVLAAGAAHLEQHKATETEGKYKRETGFMRKREDKRVGTTSPKLAAFAWQLGNILEDLTAAYNNINPGLAQNLETQAMALIEKLHQLTDTYAEFDKLRQMGAYLVLNYIMQNSPDQRKRKRAKLALREALHRHGDHHTGPDATFWHDINLGHQMDPNLMGRGPVLALAPINRAPAVGKYEGKLKEEERRQQRDRLDKQREAYNAGLNKNDQYVRDMRANTEDTDMDTDEEDAMEEAQAKEMNNLNSQEGNPNAPTWNAGDTNTDGNNDEEADDQLPGGNQPIGY